MKIYVGNLSYTTNDQGLNELFAQFGEVADAKVVIDRETRRSKGFGFVEMPNQNQGEEAIRQLDGRQVDGRNLRVNVAQPREERAPRSNRW
ncbi:MAG: RNA-binding protein [Spirochaetales bacterium]|nr:RNA-binding protein [Spirochaetales bacterium]